MNYAFYVPQTINPGSSPSASLGFKNNLHNYLESKMEVDGNTYQATYNLQYDNAYSHGMVKCSSSPKTGVSGFNFAGWYLMSTSNGTMSISRKTTSSVLSFDDRMVALYWTDNNANPVVYKSLMPVYYLKANGITISFDKQSGSGGSDSITTTYTYAMPSISVPSRSGYTFEGYYTEPNGGGTKYYDANGSSTKTCDLVGSTTLYAYWKSTDTESPIIHRVTYQYNKENGYYVYAYVTDNVGIDRVQFPTWTEYNGQDDLISGWQTNSSASGTLGSWTINGEVYNYRYYVARSAHNNEDGPYTTHIYAYDKGGNSVARGSDVCMYLNSWECYASDSYASGSGTEASPYIIKTPEQLAKLAVEGKTKEITGHYKLGANIDLSAHEWTPIGIGQTYRLQGVFDGNFYCISNMKIESVYTDHTGLFATVYNTGVVKNLIMKSGNIKQGSNVGGISGLADNGGTIKNCIVENMTLQSSTGNNFVGGITGWSWNSNITNNIVRNCNISGIYSGALFGMGQGSGASRIIDNGVYSNTISGTNAGALYGEIETSAYTVSGCYGQGTVNGTLRKQMYGDSSAWGNWSYSPMLNSGYPVQKTLYYIGGISGSQNVYNYLIGTLKFNIA